MPVELRRLVQLYVPAWTSRCHCIVLDIDIRDVEFAQLFEDRLLCPRLRGFDRALPIERTWLDRWNYYWNWRVAIRTPTPSTNTLNSLYRCIKAISCTENKLFADERSATVPPNGFTIFETNQSLEQNSWILQIEIFPSAIPCEGILGFWLLYRQELTAPLMWMHSWTLYIPQVARMYLI